MAAPGPVRVRAVPWKTSIEERTRQALGELPAYIRRARRLERAIDLLFRKAGEEYRAGRRFVEMHRRRLLAARSNASREARALRLSVERFNRRWLRWVEDSDLLADANAQIEAYNRCYPLERECALRYVPLSAIRFRPREELTPEDLLARFPLLSSDGR